MKITDENRNRVKDAISEQVDEATEYLGFRVSWNGDYEYVTIKLRTHSPQPVTKVGHV